MSLFPLQQAVTASASASKGSLATGGTMNYATHVTLPRRSRRLFSMIRPSAIAPGTAAADTNPGSLQLRNLHHRRRRRCRQQNLVQLRPLLPSVVAMRYQKPPLPSSSQFPVLMGFIVDQQLHLHHSSATTPADASASSSATTATASSPQHALIDEMECRDKDDSESGVKVRAYHDSGEFNAGELQEFYDILDLKSFSDREIERLAESIPRENNDLVTREGLSALIQLRILEMMIKREEKQQDMAERVSVGMGRDVEVEKKAASISSKAEWRLHQAKVIEQYADRQAGRFLNLLSRKRGRLQTNLFAKESFVQRGPTPTWLPSSSSELSMSRKDFIHAVRDLSTRVDLRGVLPLSASMLLVGSSVGVIVPLMPFIAENLSLSPGEYGAVVSSFALAKLLGNVPSAIFVERHGRKPYLVYSLALCAIGVGGIGIATSLEQLIACRLVVGLSVSALTTAASLTIADLSTPRNRAATMAPINSSFSAGAALGPAIGGWLGDHVGLESTFLVVGLSFLGMAVTNNAIITETSRLVHRGTVEHFSWERGHETKPTSSSSESSLPTQSPTYFGSFGEAFSQWAPLLSDSRVRSVVTMNGLYWLALAGGQMTLLPLKLTSAMDPGLAMSPSMVGKVYMGMSLVQVLGNPVVARVVDRVGSAPSIVAGCATLGTSMAALPLVVCGGAGGTLLNYHLAAILGCWSLGNAVVSTAPFARVTEVVPLERRAQAVALLRTSGDLGFFGGAVAAGTMADVFGSMDTAMMGCGGFLLAASGWFSTRQHWFKLPSTGVANRPNSAPKG